MFIEHCSYSEDALERTDLAEFTKLVLRAEVVTYHTIAGRRSLPIHPSSVRHSPKKQKIKINNSDLCELNVYQICHMLHLLHSGFLHKIGSGLHRKSCCLLFG